MTLFSKSAILEQIRMTHNDDDIVNILQTRHERMRDFVVLSWAAYCDEAIFIRNIFSAIGSLADDKKVEILNAKGNYELTALHWAADKGNTESVQAILDAILALPEDRAEAILSARDQDGLTALHRAADKGNTESVQAILEAIQTLPEDRAEEILSARDQYELTALQYAIRKKNNDSVRSILATIQSFSRDRAGEILSARGQYKHTALYSAVSGANQEAARAILETIQTLSVTKQQEIKNAMLRWADQHGYTRYAQQLLAVPVETYTYTFTLTFPATNPKKGYTLRGMETNTDTTETEASDRLNSDPCDDKSIYDKRCALPSVSSLVSTGLFVGLMAETGKDLSHHFPAAFLVLSSTPMFGTFCGLEVISALHSLKKAVVDKEYIELWSTGASVCGAAGAFMAASSNSFIGLHISSFLLNISAPCLFVAAFALLSIKDAVNIVKSWDQPQERNRAIASLSCNLTAGAGVAVGLILMSGTPAGVIALTAAAVACLGKGVLPFVGFKSKPLQLEKPKTDEQTPLLSLPSI